MSKFCPSLLSSFFFQVGNEIRPGEKGKLLAPPPFLFFLFSARFIPSTVAKEEGRRRRQAEVFSLVCFEDAQMYSYHKPKKNSRKRPKETFVHSSTFRKSSFESLRYFYIKHIRLFCCASVIIFGLRNFLLNC